MPLQIKNLSVITAGKTVVRNVTLEVKPNLISVIMGPNGSGKSSLANAVAGHPKYKVSGGKLFLDKTEITEFSPEKKAKAGLFLSMQNPPQVAGVPVTNFLRLAKAALTGQPQNPVVFHEELTKKMRALKMDPDFARRHINLGFSGGEKKRLEILTLLVLEPRYAILDEIDSGLDVDALKIVAEGINAFHSARRGLVLITHYNRILKYLAPDVVHIMNGGKIIKTGGPELAEKIEKHGYAKFL